MIALNLRPTLQLTDEVFERICQQNPDLRLERTAHGELISQRRAIHPTRQTGRISIQWCPVGLAD